MLCWRAVGWAGMHGGCDYKHEVRTWECAHVQEPSCMADTPSEQCSSAWDRNETQMPHLEVWELCRNRDCTGCERSFTAPFHSNPSGGEWKRGLGVMRLLLLVEEDTRREEAEWHKSSVLFSPQDFGILLILGQEVVQHQNPFLPEGSWIAHFTDLLWKGTSCLNSSWSYCTDFERIVFVRPTPPCSSRGMAETGGCGCGTEVPALDVDVGWALPCATASAVGCGNCHTKCLVSRCSLKPSAQFLWSTSTFPSLPALLSSLVLMAAWVVFFPCLLLRLQTRQKEEMISQSPVLHRPAAV